MEDNTITTVAIRCATSTNLMEGITKKLVLITLETVFKRGGKYGCATESARNVDGAITTPQGFILSGSVIQALSVFRLIMTIENFQSPLPIKGLMSDCLEYKALKAICICNISQLSMS